MQGQWPKIVKKLTFWLITEVMLNLAGLDNLADYSEFLFERNLTIALPNIVEVAIALPPQNSEHFYISI